jgi:hypothetical protein
MKSRRYQSKQTSKQKNTMTNKQKEATEDKQTNKQINIKQI